jgi:tyrosine-protein kinase Etk/Wzc
MQQPQKNSQDTTPTGGFIQIISRYIPYWPLFLVLLVICLGCAKLYLRYTTPIYESTATILIKDESKGMENSEALASLNIFGSKKIVENEIEVIRSRTVMKNVVKNLGLYAPIYIDGKISSVSAYISSPIKIFLKDADSLVETGKVYCSYNPDLKQVTIDGQPYILNQWINSKWGSIKFIVNKRYAEPAQKKALFFLLIDVKKIANGLVAGLDVSPASKLSSIINLKLYDDVPQRGEDILNEVISVYNAVSIDEKNKSSANALSFVTARLKSVVQELDSSEIAIQRFKANKGIVDISEQGKQFLQNVGDNDQKISGISVQLSVLDQVEKYVMGKDNTSGIVPSTAGLTDGLLSSLLEKLNTAEIQYEKLRKTTGENNTVLQSLRDQIEKIKPSILENIHSQRDNLIASRSNLASTSEGYKSMLRDIPQKERELIEISRSQAIKNNVYSFLLQKKEEAALSFASTVPDSRLVDRAESGINPVSPKKNLIYGIAILLALGIPVGYVLLKDLFVKKILFRSEIGDLLSFPVIGEIVNNTSRDNLVIGDGDRTFIAEQFRQIRSSLSYLGIGNGKKKVLVTSCISGEGKSFVAANLALSLALTEKKVVLLELDLRKPSLGKIFNGISPLGISDFLKGRISKEQIVHRTHENENLFIISSGNEVSNPSEILLNGKLEELLKYLEGHYDYIIMESGPVNAVTDPLIISNLCDATLFVIRYNYTSREQINVLKEHLKVRELKNAAIIFNGVNSVGFGKYGAAYGYTDKKKKDA